MNLSDPTMVAVVGSILIALAGGFTSGLAFWIIAVVILVVEVAVITSSRRR